MGHGLALAEVLLDASLWRALGEARGWAPYEWRARWHRMIEVLADGFSIDEYFDALNG